MSIFLENKYSNIYHSIIKTAKSQNRVKQVGDGYQTHHIIPRCMGGTDDSDNLVVLTYKEHRVCHRLLIEMTKGEYRHKMMYAYLLFNKSYDTSKAPSPQIYCTEESYRKMAETRKRKGSYKRGKDNIFSTPEIIEQVRYRMTKDNPMKRPEQKERMRQQNNNPHCNPIVVEGITFPSIGAAARHFNTTPYKLKKNFSVERNPAGV
jgi:hypothetical protein